MLSIKMLLFSLVMVQIINTVKAQNDLQNILVKQMMLDRMNLEEKFRSEGNSGVKNVRHESDGTRPYHADTHTGNGFASLHDHGNDLSTIGMGEIQVVLNGVDFRTRHNDYSLLKPHSTSKDYFAVEHIEFPDVPPTVTGSVEEQVAEMREYFRAFAEQDTSIRDYRPYFKPLISYIEGAWIIPDGKEIEEPFHSDRHWYEADTWQDLEHKVQFTGYSGSKDNRENYGWIPRAIVGVDNKTNPIIAQWTYRILTHPLKDDLPTNRLSVVDDLATRMATGMTVKEYEKSREARFMLNPSDSEQYEDKRYENTLLDDLMTQVPGLDNYQGSLHDEAFGTFAYEPTKSGNVKLNAAYYHHKYKIVLKDAMGQPVRHRGYSDATLFMAMNTQEKVISKDFNNCLNDWKTRSDCNNFSQRWSYAIPMEILYTTPLAKWNPYNILYHGYARDPASPVAKDGRDGSEERPFNGTNSMHFLRTPAEFFYGNEYSKRPADCTDGMKYVLDSNGISRKVRPSGQRTHIPILAEGMEPIRQRFPIMPVHEEGSTVWKELAALKDFVFNPQKYAKMLHD